MLYYYKISAYDYENVSDVIIYHTKKFTKKEFEEIIVDSSVDIIMSGVYDTEEGEIINEEEERKDWEERYEEEWKHLLTYDTTKEEFVKRHLPPYYTCFYLIIEFGIFG